MIKTEIIFNSDCNWPKEDTNHHDHTKLEQQADKEINKDIKFECNRDAKDEWEHKVHKLTEVPEWTKLNNGYD